MLLDLMNLGLIGASSLQREGSESGGETNGSPPPAGAGASGTEGAFPEGVGGTDISSQSSLSRSQKNPKGTGKAHLGLLGLLGLGGGTVLAAGCFTPTQVGGALSDVVSGVRGLMPTGQGMGSVAKGAADAASDVGGTLLQWGGSLWDKITGSAWGQNIGAWGNAINASTVGGAKAGGVGTKVGAVLGVPVAAFKSLFGGCMAAGFAEAGAWTAAIPGFLGMGLLWAGYHKTIGKSISKIGEKTNNDKFATKIRKDVTNLTFAGGNVFATLSILAAGACTPMALAWATPFMVGAIKRVCRIPKNHSKHRVQ